MIRKTLFALVALLGISISGFAAPDGNQPSVGIVNFVKCMSDSKLGKREQESFDSLKNQLDSLLTNTQEEMTQISQQLNDPEHLDSLSPEGEQELKEKFQSLSQEMSRYQNQYYQVMNQAQMNVLQKMRGQVQEASKEVARKHKFLMVLNEEACFYRGSALDVTNLIIAEMDKAFEGEMQKVVDTKTSEKIEKTR